MNRQLLVLLWLCAPAVHPALSEPSVAIRPEADSQQAPHGRGNVYAPDILRSEGPKVPGT